jgi:oxygen-independent coproporphyrinogen III oxidase
MVRVLLGIYISVPFCRTKCSYCNFASDVFSRAVFERYVDRICADIEKAPQVAAEVGGQFERKIDTIYLGGGTPTVLDAGQLERIFNAVRHRFEVEAGAEVTVECAPGTLTAGVVESLLRCGVNRVSLGVQSFVDREAAAVGRLHKRVTVLDDIARLRAAGIANINIDLIAGLPHQTAESWTFSVTEAIATGAQHVSVYLLEVDEDSRLGNEVLAGGSRYHAHFVPDEDATVDLYLAACGMLQSGEIAQYEISNFARDCFESRHNLKYWMRQPYFGFGVDAHSMLLSACAEVDCQEAEAIRFASADSLEQYMNEASSQKSLPRTVVSRRAALEESFFLGLRLVCGVDARAAVAELVDGGLMQWRGDFISLTPKGRLLSNEVFQRFLSPTDSSEAAATAVSR